MRMTGWIPPYATLSSPVVDVIQGLRTALIGIGIISGIIRMLCGVRVQDTTSGFRACNRELTEFFSLHYAQDYPEPEAIVAAVLNGWRVGEVPVVMEERMGGVSSISPLKGGYYMIKVTLALFIYRISLIGKRRKGGKK